MSERILGRAAKLAAALLAATAVLAVAAGPASATIVYSPIYKNIASPLPGNVPSQAFEATSTSEFGGQVGFASASAGNTKVTVAMSSWACQSGHWWASSGPEKCVKSTTEMFSWPVTLKIYLPEPDGSVGPKIAQLTQTFKMPYRPTASETCTGGGRDGGWGTNCYHGKLFKITFPLKGVYLSGNAIISVSYNTSDYGAEPQRPKACNSEPQGCPYDSLNVGLTGTPSPGSLPLPNDAYLNSSWIGPGSEAYCDEGAGGAFFRLDSGCWTGYQPEFEVTTG